jgi:beta-aspartyl-peptidase (threonine type)
VAAGEAIKEEQPVWGEGDTVGAVAIDRQGHCAAITSTGGTSFKALGRVGDSALIGAGLAADDELGATSSTGIGEEILRCMLCADALIRLRQVSAPVAAHQACERLRHRLSGRGGLVLLDRHGNLGLATTTESMSWALMDDKSDEPRSGVKVPDLDWQMAQNNPG